MKQLITWILTAAMLAFAPVEHSASNDPRAFQSDEKTPTREEVEQATEALRLAFAQKDIDLQIATLNDFRVADTKVIDYQRRALQSKEPKLVQAALEALRYTAHPDALRLLHKECKRGSELRKDETLAPLLYKAIGQHGSTSSIKLLRDKLYAETSRDIVRARLFGLANIRDRKALETLLELQRGAKPSEVNKYARESRICLIQLAGVDRGESPDRWREWWAENKRDFEMAEKAPLMPIEMQRSWDSFWGIQRIMPRGERREDRGEE